MQNNNLQIYLYRINWNEKQFTNDRLEIMLAASCLRYLGNLEDISFILGLSKTIREKYQEISSLPLHHAISILHDLTDELHNNTLLSTDTEIIRKNINNAQEVITRRKYE